LPFVGIVFAKTRHRYANNVGHVIMLIT